MSFQAMTWAVEQDLPLKEKMTLLMMANHCNHHTGQCNPSLSRLAKECGMGKTALLSAIKTLENKNYLRVIRKQIGDVHLPNQYRLNFEWGSAREELPSAPDVPRGSPPREQGVVREADINQEYEPKRTITTTPVENFKNFELTIAQRECFEWAKENDYWQPATQSIEEFLQVYHKPKGGMRKQFEMYKNTHNTGGNNGTHRQPSKKLSPAERVRKAAGIGEFAVGAGDYLEHNRSG